MSILDTIQGPADLQDLSLHELNQLSEEIRNLITEIVSKNGGHLSSNLGVVELTLAIHRVFSSENDSIVWDVGHQAYTHKILTGRKDQIHTIRKANGLSGYPTMKESKYDAFGTGHASTSISAALGIAYSKMLRGEDGHTVAVIGDGALTGGLAFEGLNNAGRFKGNFTVILNDNTMSISRNVGSIAKYLTHIRTRPGYRSFKGHVEFAVDHIPLIGKSLHKAISKINNFVRHLVYKNTVFEDLGFRYYGPLDGHNIKTLLNVLEGAKLSDKPVLLHIVTKKGKGYSYAEKQPGIYHGVSGFNVDSGITETPVKSFSSTFGDILCDMAAKDDRICAITAAMAFGTGLLPFSEKFPNRFFDVGIAEEHAVTFSAGLAAGGCIPVCAVYSTFLQRGYDQLIHDAALQNLRMVFAIDRAGIVGEDGETHQGIFDTAFLNSIPNVTVYAPSTFSELKKCMDLAIYHTNGVAAVRYPRGKEISFTQEFTEYNSYSQYGTSPITILTYGRMIKEALEAAEILDGILSVQIIKMNQILPIPEDLIQAVLDSSFIFFFEDAIQNGGIGEHMGSILMQKGYKGKFCLKAISNFVPHASMKETLQSLGLDAHSIANTIKTECKK